MNAAFWIKLYTDTFENPKIGKLRRLPAGNDILLIWIMLLATAGKCNAGGLVQITEQIPFTVEDLADKFKFKENTIKFALKAFEEYDMIEIFEGGFIYIKNWSEYQSEDKLAELRARDRERKRIKRAEAKALIAGTAAVPESVHGNVRGQSEELSAECPSYRVEKEEKKEYKERRGEKNPNHSFIHSAPPDNKNEYENDEIAYENEGEKYIEAEVAKVDFDGDKKAEAEYRERLRDSLRMKFLSGELGQDVVFMSEAQFDKLCEFLSLDEIEKYFAVVVKCEIEGKHYVKKSHYQAILDMAIRDRGLISKK